MNLTTLGVVREREQGTAEQLSVTSIRPLDLIIGKLIPPIFVGYIIITLVLVVGLLWFGIGFAGSTLLIFPVSNMPKAIQAITYFLPMRYYLKVIRGAGFGQLWNEALILLVRSVIIITIASLRLKKRLV